jgi:hypothetical protein
MAWLYFRRVMQQKRPGLHWGQIVSVVLMLMLSTLAVGIHALAGAGHGAPLDAAPRAVPAGGRWDEPADLSG